MKLETKPRYKLDLEIGINNKKVEFNNRRSKLLQCIARYGSIAKASKEASVSYRTALKNIETMEREFGSHIVITKRGGKGGGGSSELTDSGREILFKFIKINQILKTRADLNELEGVVSSVDEEKGIMKIVLNKRELLFPITHNLKSGDEVFILIRPIDVVVMPPNSDFPVVNMLEGIITGTQLKNDIIHLNINISGNNIIAYLSGPTGRKFGLNCGKKLFIGFKADSADIYKKDNYL